MEAIWFLLGIVVGAAIVWFLLQRLSDQRVAESEARVRRELEHAQGEARDADLAHAETKERLIALQARVTELEGVLEGERAELAAARGRLVQLESRAAAVAEAQARLERVEAELARQRAATPAPEPTPVPAAAAAGSPAAVGPSGPAEELRRLDARLAMLPAGSSARALLLRRRQELAARAEHLPAPAGPPPASAPPTAPSRRERAAPAGDDLKLIKGIGPVLERRLHELGVRTFADLAALTPARVKEIDEAIDFPGRIERERWIEQARDLLARRPG